MTSVALLAVMHASWYSHTSTVLLATGKDGRVVVERPRLGDRLAARWRARALDRALADGVSPEASAALSLRAQRLTEPDCRWSIAGALRRIVREAQQPRRTRLGRIEPNLRAVSAASDALRQLADTLDDPGPVAAHGVAQAWLLLTDGTGPLYNPRTRVPLGAHAARAARELRPWVAD
jgi:hypothetical protein